MEHQPFLHAIHRRIYAPDTSDTSHVQPPPRDKGLLARLWGG